MHEPPTWTRTASDNAMISRDELLQWLGVESRNLAKLIANRGLPRPRRAGIWHTGKAITKTCQWRVGDVRAWLRRGDVEAAVSTPLKPKRPGGIELRSSGESKRIAFGAGSPVTKPR